MPFSKPSFRWRIRSGSCLGAAEPFVESDAAEARFAQRHERVLLDPAAEVSGLGITHHLASVTDGLRKTFERIRREQAGSTYETRPSSEPARKKVVPMPVRQEVRKSLRSPSSR